MEALKHLKDNVSLKDAVYEALKLEIILGHFKAGESLNILELANTMNISSAPIREALNMLQQDGFVILNPRRKAIVSSISLQDYDIVNELRQMLEPYAAKLSVGKVPKGEIEDLRQRLNGVILHPENMHEYVSSDLTLHEILHIHAGSLVLSDILTTLKEHSLRIRYCNEETAQEDLKRQSVITATLEHLEILSMLERGSPDEVYQCVQRHLGNYLQRTQFINESILKQFISGTGVKEFSL